ncbi:MAG TPA: hypothetical protein VER03_20315 [Bryobacteraceae bacterium]|nr:hypothetical protein [Bryobacteraceae bacterium]
MQVTRRQAIGIAVAAAMSNPGTPAAAQPGTSRPRNVHYYGSTDPLPRQVTLQAGALTMIFEPELAQLRYIRLGDKEVLRAIYAAVRDRNWGTVTPRISNLKAETTENAFTLTFDVACAEGAIDVLWHGRISGDAQGTVRFDFDAEARSTFLRNRLGFCVLHPIDGCAGQPVTIGKSDGSVERGTFPSNISPHQPFMNVQSIRHTIEQGVDAEVLFTGDVFEMEDHRNWTDASYKTYCTPLALPFPVEVKKGARVQQSVTLRLHGTSTRASRTSTSPEVRIETRQTETTPMPRIGLGAATHSVPLTTSEAERLRVLRPAHLRVDLALDRDGWNASLARAAREAKAIRAPLEIAITLGDKPQAELERFAAALPQIESRLAQCLVFSKGRPSTDAAAIELARGVIKRVVPGVRIISGTDAYFTEINRARPPLAESDAICYSINPQVHAFDNTSLVETLPMQGATVRSARAFAGALPIAVTPVTLKPRSNPNATGVIGSPNAAAALPAQVDPRQMSLFAGAWTLGSVKYLAEASAASVTYYETTGWRGVMETAKGSPLPALFPSRPSEVFPIYHVLADIGDFTPTEVIRTQSSDPLRADSLLLRKPNHIRLLVANLTAELQQIRMMNPGFSKAVRVTMLDEHTVAHAMSNPEAFRRQPGSLRELGSAAALTISLLPYAYARIDQA